MTASGSSDSPVNLQRYERLSPVERLDTQWPADVVGPLRLLLDPRLEHLVRLHIAMDAERDSPVGHVEARSDDGESIT